MEETCRLCRYWNEAGTKIGECRRYPPRVLPRHITTLDEVAWTATNAHDWCGEFRGHANGAEKFANERPMSKSIDEHRHGEPRRLLSERETAQLLGISRLTLTKWRTRGSSDTTGPPFLRFGRAIRYDSNDLETWIATKRFGDYG